MPALISGKRCEARSYRRAERLLPRGKELCCSAAAIGPLLVSCADRWFIEADRISARVFEHLTHHLARYWHLVS